MVSRIDAWTKLAGLAMTDRTWKVAASQPHGTLSYRSAPCDGSRGRGLIKIDMRDILVINGPEKVSDIMVRPEVRGSSIGKSLDGWYPELRLDVLQNLAPGDVLAIQYTRIPILRLLLLFFGDSAGLLKANFMYNTEGALTRLRLRKDYPEPGDACLVNFQEIDGSNQEYMQILRNEDRLGRIRVVTMFSTPTSKFASWASPLFSVLIDLAHRTMQGFCNRLGVQALRDLDRRFYVVLALRSFNRGSPLLPAHDRVPDDGTVPIHDRDGGTVVEVTISSEDPILRSWTRFDSGGKFRFDKYLQMLLQRLGHREVQVFNSLDCRTLVPYQCVMRTEQWKEVRESCLQALTLQKTAYRRANGGTTAPSLVEDTLPRFTSDCPEVIGDIGDTKAKVVVRKTFLELQESPNEAPLRRSRSECDEMVMLKDVQYCEVW